MIQNQILLKRMCQLIAQTFAVPLDQVLENSKKIGVEAVIEQLEAQTTIKY